VKQTLQRSLRRSDRKQERLSRLRPAASVRTLRGGGRGLEHDFDREVRRRRDQSLYVTHFTKAVDTAEGRLSPGQVLRRILRERSIYARPVGDRCAGGGRDADAVCLTEAPLLGLIVPTAPRSPAHGIGFDKRFVYRQGGMPVIYLRRDLIEPDGTPPMDPRLYPFVKPFEVEVDNPTYEREWRVPRDLSFTYAEVAFLIVPRDERPRFCAEFPDLQRVLDYEFLLESM